MSTIRDDHLQSILAWKADLARVREEAAVVARANARTENEGHTHTQMPAWPRDLGLATGYQIWIASNDRSRMYGEKPVGTGFCQTCQRVCSMLL